MTDQGGRSTPDDEPVIGLDDLETVFARGGARARSGEPPEIGAPIDESAPAPLTETENAEEYDDEFDGFEDEYDESASSYGRYEDFYEDESPARQPVFYVFVALAVLVGGLFVFFLMTIFQGGDDGPSATATTAQTSILVSVDAPMSGTFVEVGEDVEVNVRARAGEDIIRFELYRGADAVDRVNASLPDADGIYSAILKMRFEEKGEFAFVVRVVAESGAEQDSPEVRLTVIEPVGGTNKPKVEGTALALVTLRVGPGDNFASAGNLEPGEEITILGRTRDSQWLLVDRGSGLWVPTAAIRTADSLALVDVQEPTPTPVPPTPAASSSPDPSGSPSATVSPTVSVDAPDFIPANASLVEAGAKLLVTVANIAPSEFSGALVVSVADIGAGGTIAQVFDVLIPAGGTVVVEFEITPPVSEPKTARITIDPDLAVADSNEDNNSASFGLTPPADSPNLVISDINVLETAVEVTIRNEGGPLASSPVTVRVTVGASTTSTEVPALALANDQSTAPISVLRPGNGTATVQVLVNEQLVAEIGGVELPEPDAADE